MLTKSSSARHESRFSPFLSSLSVTCNEEPGNDVVLLDVAHQDLVGVVDALDDDDTNDNRVTLNSELSGEPLVVKTGADMQKSENMIKLGPSYSQAAFVSQSYLELRDSPPDLSSPTDQLSSSGESGCFDASSFCDLQSILETAERNDFHSNSQGLSPTESGIHDATSFLEEDRGGVELTYLGPVPLPVQLSVSAADISTQSMHFDTTCVNGRSDQQQQQQQLFLNQPNESLDLPILTSSLSSGSPWPESLVIKAEPDQLEQLQFHVPSSPATSATPTILPTALAAGPSNTSTVQVQLMKREQTNFLNDPQPFHTQPFNELSSYHHEYSTEQDLIYSSSSSSSHSHPPPLISVPSNSGRRKNGQKSVRNPRFGDYGPCHVCGGAAGRHSYYGGHVCASCRAFFRRSVQSKYYNVYSCSKNGNCLINEKTRKHCQYCRFKLCEMANMKKSWVLADGERRNVKGGQKNRGKHGHNVAPFSFGPLIPLNPTESSILNEVLSSTSSFVEQQTYQLDIESLSELSNMVKNKNSQMSLESRKSLREFLTQRTRLFALSLADFTSFSSQDQMILLNANLDMLMKFRLASAFQPTFNWRKQLNFSLGANETQRLSDRLIGLKVDEVKKLEFKQFFKQSTNYSDKSNLKLFNKICSWVEENGETAFSLLSLVILFNSENGLSRLEHPLAVQDKELQYLSLLHRFLQSVYGQKLAASKLAAAVGIIISLREIQANVLLSEAELIQSSNYMQCNY